MRKNGPNLFSNQKSYLSDKARIIVRVIIKTLIIVLIVFFCILFLTHYLLASLKKSDYFIVKEIIFAQKNPPEKSAQLDLSYLKGKNIFAIDLLKESKYIAIHYPNYRNVKLVRVLPSRLYVYFATRQAVGIIKSHPYLCVDEERVFFEHPEPLGDSNLPFITGLETKIFNPQPGRNHEPKELTLALNIIKEITVNKTLKDYKVTRIDVAHPSSASFFILVATMPLGYTKGQMVRPGFESLEVKLGSEDIRNKINILANLLTQMKNEQAGIKYIDLRFKEPVIKLKDAK